MMDEVIGDIDIETPVMSGMRANQNEPERRVQLEPMNRKKPNAMSAIPNATARLVPNR